MSTLAITGGRVLLPDFTTDRLDVLVDIERGTITEVGAGVAGDETLDAEGCLVTPGFVNGHCHVAMTLLRGYADDKPLDTWLAEDIWPAEGELTPQDVRAGADLGILEMIEGGVTAFVDMYFHMESIVEAVEAAGVRARLGHGVVTVGKDEEAAVADAEESIAFAETYDGAANGRVETAFMPHALTTVSTDVFEAFVPEARARDLPIHVHANETRDEVDPIVEEEGVRPLEYAREVGLLEPDDFVAHGVHVDETEIEILAESGASVIHCPASNMKLASGMAPVQTLLDAGVTVGLGTDGAASNNDLSMLDEARDAAMLGKLAADDASAVDARTVAEMLTAGNADAIGLPGGRIEAGAAADLAVIDLDAAHLTPVHDPVSHLAYAARASDVRHTVCDGRVLMRDREVLTMDETAVRERAAERARAVVDRAGD